MVNHAKQFGGTQSTFRINILIGKMVDMHIEVFCLEMESNLSVNCAKERTRESLLFTILIKIEKTILLKIWSGCATIATTLSIGIRESKKNLWRLSYNGLLLRFVVPEIRVQFPVVAQIRQPECDSILAVAVCLLH